MDGTITLPASINPCSLFLVWQALGGEAAHVSRATGVKVSIIKALEHDLCWNDLAGGKLGVADKQLHRDINRALNYAQGKRLQAVLDKTLEILEEDDFAKLRSSLVLVDQGGQQSLNTKPLVELAKATATVHDVIYRALGDKVAIEADKVQEDSDKIRNLSLTVFNAVNRAAVTTGALSSAEVVRAHKDAINV